jgi:hypothetical protein
MRDDVLAFMDKNFGKKEPAQLTWAEYDKLCNAILETPKIPATTATADSTQF